MATQPPVVARGDVRIEGREPEGSATTAVEVPNCSQSAQPAPQPPACLSRASSLAELGIRVSVVIAALDEEKNLPDVFASLPSGLHEVIVVDGHSTDRTVNIARELRPDVRILTQTGTGTGNALAEDSKLARATSS